jgi:hypothetical protein
MSANIIINVMGTKEDVQKLFDTLCEPNKYNGTGINLDRESIYPVKGTAFPLWEAKGETYNVPKRDDEFKDLYADFTSLGICLNFYSDVGEAVACFYGTNGLCEDSQLCTHVGSLEYFVENQKSIYDNWKTLKYIPKTLTKTEPICFEAVKENGNELRFVPDELRTVDLCLEAVRQIYNALRYVPDKLKTAELCLEAVRLNGYALEYVPEELKTKELCFEAVKEFSWALQYVPDKLRAAELCLEALQQDINVHKHVPDELKASKQFLEMMKQAGCSIDFIPEDTEELRRTGALTFEEIAILSKGIKKI